MMTEQRLQQQAEGQPVLKTEWQRLVDERDAAIAERDKLDACVGDANVEHAHLTMRAVEAENARDEFARVALGNAEAVAGLTAALTEARRVLRLCEWDTNSLCLVCRLSDNDGHAPDCALAAVLAQEEAK